MSTDIAVEDQLSTDNISNDYLMMVDLSDTWSTDDWLRTEYKISRFFIFKKLSIYGSCNFHIVQYRRVIPGEGMNFDGSCRHLKIDDILLNKKKIIIIFSLNSCVLEHLYFFLITYFGESIIWL